MTEIKTSRLLIRPIDTSQTAGISEQNSTSGNLEYLENLANEDLMILFRNRTEVAQLTARLSEKIKRPDRISYGAWLEEEMIGYISLLNHTADVPEIQIELAPRYHRQGYGYEFLHALLSALFKEKFTAFSATVLPSNTASQALMIKAGGVLQEPTSDVARILFKTYLFIKNR